MRKVFWFSVCLGLMLTLTLAGGLVSKAQAQQDVPDKYYTPDYRANTNTNAGPGYMGAYCPTPGYAYSGDRNVSPYATGNQCYGNNWRPRGQGYSGSYRMGCGW